MKRNRSTSSSTSSPVATAGSRESSTSSSGSPATAARTSSFDHPSEHGGLAQQVDGAGLEPVEPAAEHVVHRCGRAAIGEQAAEVAAVPGQPGVLHEEEGIAVGAPAEPDDVVGRGVGAGHGRHQPGGVRVGQAAEPETDGVGTAERFCQIGQRAVRRRLLPPRGDDQQPTGGGVRAHGLHQHPEQP